MFGVQRAWVPGEIKDYTQISQESVKMELNHNEKLFATCCPFHQDKKINFVTYRGLDFVTGCLKGSPQSKTFPGRYWSWELCLNFLQQLFQTTFFSFVPFLVFPTIKYHIYVKVLIWFQASSSLAGEGELELANMSRGATLSIGIPCYWSLKPKMLPENNKG